ncbi:NnrU family protein [Cereibacter sphaeroides]|uniref:NnrU family protein n=1 Tax=Cereibacter sphaeroides TaxID=1063 RepID=UPI001F25F5A2|nr:NnrU family protein [Cereibacter sphaeroides]MCE6951232.1 NnrU family protein [Cereibacter sphaeroides]
MLLLILGVALWSAAHLFKRVAPALRAPLGDAGKGVAALLLVTSLVLMVMGYRAADFISVYTPPPGIGHANNLIMLIALIVFGAGMSKGWLWTKIRHPMLYGFVIWAFAHLLVNGDVASLILFGGLGAWAVAEIVLINRQTEWVRPVSGGPKRDLALIGVVLVMYGLIALVHIWTGHTPFAGTYA